MQADIKLGVIAMPRAVTQGKAPNSPAATGQAAAETTGKTLPQEPAAEVRQEELQSAMKRISDYVQNVRRELQFSIDEESGRTIIRVIDAETEEVIRQLPPEELLQIARHIEAGEMNLVEAKA
jgi:flagellar protein FlaG